MTRKELIRHEVLTKANSGVMTVKEASAALGVSERQIKRLKKAVKEGGAEALIHGNRGRRPAHSVSEEEKAEIVELKRGELYAQSNFSHFRELLSEHHGIEIGYSALHALLTAAGEKSPKKRRRYKPHRRRARRAQAGLLVQTDATPYAWFRGDKAQYALHGAIDDATGQVTGLYMARHECLLGYFEMMRRTICNYGIPAAVYADRHTIFQSPNKAKAEIDPRVPVSDTQFGRCLKELSIQLIAARSPQAKGRVERLWQTLQGRLPIEFALRGITTVDAANEFLQSYIYAYNSQFAVEPELADNAFSRLPDGASLDHILCVKETRRADAGGVFSYGGRQFKVLEDIRSGSLPPGAHVSVLLGPAFGIKAQFRGVVYDVEPFRKPSRRAAKPPAAPLASTPRAEPANAVYKSGIHRTHYVESDADIMDMLYDIFSIPLAPPDALQIPATPCGS